MEYKSNSAIAIVKGDVVVEAHLSLLCWKNADETLDHHNLGRLGIHGRESCLPLEFGAA